MVINKGSISQAGLQFIHSLTLIPPLILTKHLLWSRIGTRDLAGNNTNLQGPHNITERYTCTQWLHSLCSSSKTANLVLLWNGRRSNTYVYVQEAKMTLQKRFHFLLLVERKEVEKELDIHILYKNIQIETAHKYTFLH